MNFNETKVWIINAAKKKDVRGLVAKAAQRRLSIRENQYFNLLTLIALENDGLWREEGEYEALTWPQFLERVDLGYSACKFQSARDCLNRFGDGAYMKYGYDILRVAYGYADRAVETIEALDIWVDDHRGRLPSLPTVVRILRIRFGAPAIPPTIDEDENEWRERFEDACIEIAGLRKEIAEKNRVLQAQTREVANLRHRNNQLEEQLANSGKKYASFVNNIKKEVMKK